MIDFSAYTYENLRQQMLDAISDVFDKRDTAPIPTAIDPAAYLLAGFYLTLNQVQQQAFIQTAVGQSLDYLAVIGGLTRYPSSAAVRLGTFNVAVPIGARFSSINGSNSINFVVTAAIPDTTYQYQLTAETTGAIGNEYSGAILPITSIAGLTSAVMTDVLIPGEDEETDDALRARLIAALNERPFGGNIASYRENILAIEGVGGLQVYPTWNGGGTVKCSILGADLLPASATLVQKVQDAIDPQPNQGLGLGLAPIGAQVTVVAPTSVDVDVGATVTLATGYSLAQVEPLVEAALEALLVEVRSEWGTNLGTINVTYAADVYLARVTAAIVGVTGVANVTGVTLNGVAADLTLTENGTTQQVPVLGTVTLSE